jgi:hypothetical protein
MVQLRLAVALLFVIALPLAATAYDPTDYEAVREHHLQDVSLSVLQGRLLRGRSHKLTLS